jgi:deoxyribonuclease V
MARVPVIGVAKTKYIGAEDVQEIRRGKSKQPLYISAVGLSALQAAEHVCSMRGPYRIPTMLKRVDLLSRGESANAQPEASPAISLLRITDIS